MSMSSHITELQKKHAELSDKVESYQRHPGANTLDIAALKKKKLMLKEEISRLSS